MQKLMLRKTAKSLTTSLLLRPKRKTIKKKTRSSNLTLAWGGSKASPKKTRSREMPGFLFLFEVVDNPLMVDELVASELQANLSKGDSNFLGPT